MVLATAEAQAKGGQKLGCTRRRYGSHFSLYTSQKMCMLYPPEWTGQLALLGAVGLLLFFFQNYDPEMTV
jgi:hypothetical protein